MGCAGIRVHPSAEVSPDADVGAGTAVWNEAQVRAGARVGRECVLGKGVYIDTDVEVGDRVKLENRVSVFRGARLGSGVFVGPHSCLLNDVWPRAVAPDGRLKDVTDWTVSGVTVEDGASIGGGGSSVLVLVLVVVPDVEIVPVLGVVLLGGASGAAAIGRTSGAGAGAGARAGEGEGTGGGMGTATGSGGLASACLTGAGGS